MKKLSGLIVGVALIGVAPLALADADPYENMPQLGGAETTFAVKADQGKGLDERAQRRLGSSFAARSGHWFQAPGSLSITN